MLRALCAAFISDCFADLRSCFDRCFSSFARWQSKEDFLNWTKSEHFKKSHSTGPKNREMYVERPELECFEVLI